MRRAGIGKNPSTLGTAFRALQFNFRFGYPELFETLNILMILFSPSSFLKSGRRQERERNEEVAVSVKKGIRKMAVKIFSRNALLLLGAYLIVKNIIIKVGRINIRKRIEARSFRIFDPTCPSVCLAIILKKFLSLKKKKVERKKKKKEGNPFIILK